MKKLGGIIFCALFTLTMYGQSAKLYPVVDKYATGFISGLDYWTNGSKSDGMIKAGEATYANYGYAGWSLFNIADIPPNAVVTYAVLKFKVKDNSSSEAFKLCVGELGVDPTRSDISAYDIIYDATYVNTTVFTKKLIGTEKNIISINLTSTSGLSNLQASINNGDSRWGIILFEENDDAKRVKIYGNESTTYKPYLYVEYNLALPLPSKPTNPSPSNGATDQSKFVDLSWANGGGTITYYEVYFGTDPTLDSGERIGAGDGTSMGLPTLNYSTTYYWRIDAVNSAGTTTGNVWSFTTEAEPVSLPSKPTNPSPSSGATNQSRNVDLSWSNGGGATSYKVYFGTDSSPDGGELQGTQSGTSFNLGTLSYSTTYYWRIDAINSAGTTTGNVWHFTTEAEPVSLPSKSTSPGPGNGATNQSRNVDLSWSNGGGATSYNVYFGTDPTPDSGESQGSQSGTSFNLGTLSYSTTYYWRIDPVNSAGTTTGNVWSFTTESEPVSLPSKSTSPGPGNGATNQSINVDISWSNGGGATSYNVYFGTDPTPDSGESQGSQSGTSFNLGTLSYSTTYYWRIDAVNSAGTTTGNVWSFTTESDITATFDVSPNNRSVSSADGTTSFTVNSTVGWSVHDDAAWLTATKTNGSTISVSYNANTSASSRTANIRAYGTGVEETVTVTQDGVSAENHPPNKPALVSPLNDAVIKVNESFHYKASGTDPDGDPLMYQFYEKYGTKDWHIWEEFSTSESSSFFWVAPITVEWKVRTVDSHGKVSEFSDVWTYTVIEETVNKPPNKPVLISPANNSEIEVGEPIAYEAIGADADGDELEYHFYENYGTGWYLWEKSGSKGSAFSWPTSVNVQWKVKTVDPSGSESEFSDVWNYSVVENHNSPPSQPVITAPANGEIVPMRESSNGNKVFTIKWNECFDSDNDSLNYLVDISRTYEEIMTENIHKTTENQISLYFSNSDYDYTGTWYCQVSSTDAIDTTASEIVMFELTWPTAINDLTEDNNELKIYPIPTTGNIQIEGLPIGKETNLSIYNLQGQLIIQKVVSAGQTSIDISKQFSGTYLLVINNNHLQTIKIIKK